MISRIGSLVSLLFTLSFLLTLLGKIPETYDVRKILESLIQELVKDDILHRSKVELIIEKGRPRITSTSIEQ